MESIFSTQNLQTFLRRKYFLPPSRAPAAVRGVRADAVRDKPPASPLCVAAAVSSTISAPQYALTDVRRLPPASIAGRMWKSGVHRRRLLAALGLRLSSGHRLRGTAHLGLANLAHLVQPLGFKIDTHGKKLDDRLRYPQPALHFLHQFAFAFQGE